MADPIFDDRTLRRVRATYKDMAARPDWDSHLAQSFYANLFAENPQLRLLFPANLEAQTHRMLTAIRYVLDNVEQPDRMLTFLGQLGRDHRKYGVAREHYEAGGRALLQSLRGSLVTLLWTPTVDAAWSEVVGTIVGTMADASDEEELPAFWDATVVAHERRLDDLAIVRLEIDEPMPYYAGQYVSVQIPQRQGLWRYYSPAIPSNPFGQIEFHVRRVPSGWVSPAIVSETQVGDRWRIGAPLGALAVDLDANRDVLMIAQGTGLAPLRAQIMDMAMRGTNPRVHLFVGGVYPRDLYDLETLWHLAMSNPWLTVVPVAEHDEDPWWNTTPPAEVPPGLHQRLHGPIGKVVASFGSWADRQIQISGSPSMVKTTLYALRAAGTPPDVVSHDPLF